MEVPQKTKNRITSNPTPGNIRNKTPIQKDTCTSTFIATLFTTAKTWKQPNGSMNGQRRCGTYTRWNITQPLKGGNKDHLQQ